MNNENMYFKKISGCVYAFMKSEMEKSFPRTGYGVVKMKHRPFRICVSFCFILFFTMMFYLQWHLHRSTGHSDANKALTFTVSPKCSQLMEEVRKRTLQAF